MNISQKESLLDALISTGIIGTCVGLSHELKIFDSKPMSLVTGALVGLGIDYYVRLERRKESVEILLEHDDIDEIHEQSTYEYLTYALQNTLGAVLVFGTTVTVGAYKAASGWSNIGADILQGIDLATMVQRMQVPVGPLIQGPQQVDVGAQAEFQPQLFENTAWSSQQGPQTANFGGQYNYQPRLFENTASTLEQGPQTADFGGQAQPGTAQNLGGNIIINRGLPKQQPSRHKHNREQPT